MLHYVSPYVHMGATCSDCPYMSLWELLPSLSVCMSIWELSAMSVLYTLMVQYICLYILMGVTCTISVCTFVWEYQLSEMLVQARKISLCPYACASDVILWLCCGCKGVGTVYKYYHCSIFSTNYHWLACVELSPLSPLSDC